MDGPLFLPFFWLFVMACVWVYRTFLERAGPRDAAFEAWCRGRPMVAVLGCAVGSGGALRDGLRRALGPRGQAVSTLGAPPFPHYRLSLEVEVPGDGRVVVRVVRGALLGARERAPALLSLVCDALGGEGAAGEAWLHPAMYIDPLDRGPCPHGWRAIRTGEGRLGVGRAEEPPDGVSPAPGPPQAVIEPPGRRAR